MAFLYASPGFRNSSSPWAKLQESPPKFKIGAASSLNMGPGHPKQESHPASLPTKRFHREKMSCSHVRLNKHQHSMLFWHAVSGHQLYSYQATCTGKLFQEVPSAKPQLCVESGVKGRRCLTVRCETGLFRVLEKNNYSSGNDHISHLCKTKFILRMPQKYICQFSEKMYLGWQCKSEFFWISVSSRYQNLIPSLELT